MSNGTIEILKVDYLRLLEASLELEALKRAGVDNWEGYSEVDWEGVDDRMAGARAALNMPAEAVNDQ